MVLSDSDKKFVKKVAEQRFSSKRNAGISSVRKDGSVCTPQNDIDATGAEFFAAKKCNQSFDDSISTKGDQGHDFCVNGKTVEVIWLGRDKRTQKPRQSGNLIVNPHEPKRWADVYLVVNGGFEEGYEIEGWTTHEKLVAEPRVDFGFGERFAMNIRKLNKNISNLQ